MSNPVSSSCRDLVGASSSITAQSNEATSLSVLEKSGYDFVEHVSSANIFLQSIPSLSLQDFSQSFEELGSALRGCFNGGNHCDTLMGSRSIDDRLKNEMNTENFPSPREVEHGLPLPFEDSDEAEFSVSGGHGLTEDVIREFYITGPSSKKQKISAAARVNEVHVPMVSLDPSRSVEDGMENQEKNENLEKKTTHGTVDNSKEDYIHVRARRGQATNSHSLAERVRREKISERMKFLQDLVPGCSKVTGKAVMLDEIINYVQSLQRQVEFLSMKLATVNPRTDLNFEGLPAKDFQRNYSSTNGFPDSRVICPPSQAPPSQGLLHSGFPNLGSSNSAQINMNSQFAYVGGYTPQSSNTWDAEFLRGGFHMNVLDRQDVGAASLSAIFNSNTKVEP